MVDSKKRRWLYGECSEGVMATRMIRDGRFKLIYCAAVNRFQLFDLQEDPLELNDLTESPDHVLVRAQLAALLRDELYGGDEALVQDRQLVGLPDRAFEPRPNRGLSGQRGIHWPPPPRDPSGQVVGAPW